MKSRASFLIIANLLIAMSLIAQVKGTFTDTRDNKVYNTVTIGKQTWMAENLAYKTTSGCWAYDNKQEYVATFGYLYDWATAKNVCPSGWYLPSEKEWDDLVKYLGYARVAAGKLKETGTSHWSEPNFMATNESGFTGIAGGIYDRYLNKQFEDIFDSSYWWCSNEASDLMAKNFELDYKVLDEESNLGEILSEPKIDGLSVRCVKD